MDEPILNARIQEKLNALGDVEIIIGIPSYDNARTIGHVVKAAQASLLGAFSGHKALIVNSDGGSKDGTPEAALAACADSDLLFAVEHPLYTVHHLTTPYHGVPGKGSAFRTLFHISEVLRARALAVADADLQSITPEWFTQLLQPILNQGYDYAAPYYQRDKYDGTLTTSIVYPLTRALYGRRIRQPIGGEFAMSARARKQFLARNVWNTEVAQYGIDMWTTTTAIAENLQICQSYLGPRIHDTSDGSPDLSGLLVQVLGSVFELMETYQSVWRNVLGSLPAPLMGTPFQADPTSRSINLESMLASYRQGVRDLLPVYENIIAPAEIKQLEALASLTDSEFAIPDGLWAAMMYEFAIAYHRRTIDRQHLVQSLTPLYLGWVASFVRQTQNETAAQVETRVEKLCLIFEQLKPYLLNQWPLRAGKEGSKP